jgi:STAS-like domain of unknown function (DUF4325)
MRDIFDKYQGEDLYFRKTHVPIALARYPGEQLVSRSQAKRVLARFPDFSEVLLDFTDVPEIGQAFADEIFRVFKNAHPDTYLAAFNTNATVDKMIKYVQSNHATLPLPFERPGDLFFWRGFLGGCFLSCISPVAIRITWTALPITSAGRLSLLRPRGIYCLPMCFE